MGKRTEVTRRNVEIVERYRAGETIEALSVAYGLSLQHVYSIVLRCKRGAEVSCQPSDPSEDDLRPLDMIHTHLVSQIVQIHLDPTEDIDPAVRRHTPPSQ